MTGARDIELPGGGTRAVPEEVPVALSYNGSTQAVMMATPADLTDLAVGFSLSEEIIRDISEIERTETLHHPMGIELAIWLKDDAQDRLSRRRRFMAGPVGCGLCGIDSLDQALRPLPPLPPDSLHLSAAQVSRAMQDLRAAQPLHDRTRATHAAGFLGPDGLPPVREDVGRHNALDKVVGALARAGRDASGGALVITSRVSVEMVQKAVLARAGVLIAASAPTGRAIDLAQEAGLTLVALARADSFEIFTHPQRITDQEARTDVA
ncbi:formate dehydrogenase accessory sulfurtransferase FdhD [Actibacterium sp. XHP0104]|uniref:formate dehydrogenase accessory sulfurtransferase FdhD n=1 Tax=Actibacterium sp. XHP0104 TaxID=2984335 RepID=UPI0021E9509A|nr:formate dehydrogenase accessory sulfurtransferase FdhD [Actibacterium sp. XHP0104]MCV2881498.1 formate dehydrogenase accessory sulfurtransferase FdhD [Actibacterium sp. XHP0104]